MPDETPEDRSDEMESDLDQLEDHIDDAKAKAAERKKDVEGALEEVAGDPDGDQDAIGGDDPVGAGEDASRDRESDGDGSDDDEREPEEVANPT